MKMVFCPQCGLLLPPGYTSCPRCGTPAPTAPRPRDPRRPTAPRAPHYAAHSAPRDGLSTAGYFAALCLFCLPVVGLVVMLIWSCASRVPARRRLARACLLWQVLVSALVLVAALGLAVLPFWQFSGILPMLMNGWRGLL